MGEYLRTSRSISICSNIENWNIFQESKSILSYMPIKGEVDLRALFLHCPEKRWVLPRILPGENHDMAFHLLEIDRLVIHPFGMAEPASTQAFIPADEIELVLVPGLAFDMSGWRLGYGGGYFDRFLGKFKGISLGVTYHALLVKELPHDAYDITVQWIATEVGIQTTGHRYNRTNEVTTNLS